VTAPDVVDLARVGLLGGLGEPDLRVIADWLDVRSVYVGEELTHEGASGYAFFILHEGTADVRIGDEVIRTLGPGEFFGELSILGDGLHTATVRITKPGVVWTLFGTRFRQLQIEHPQIAAEIERTARQRLAGR
jgi:CRP-like cAMP-binding protein